MAEKLSPGVFIEEAQEQVQTVLAVTTSSMGGTGFTSRGPTDVATLVTSPDQYTRVFGPHTSLSHLGMNVLAFFANGGRRAYISRVVPSDAVAADCRLQGTYVDQLLKDNPAAGTWSALAAVTPFKVDGAPLVPGSVSMRYRTAGAAVLTPQPTMDAAGTSVVVGELVAPLTPRLVFAGQLTDHYSLVVAGATADGDVQYIAKQSGDQSAITVEVVVAGVSTPFSIVTVGTAITINSATDAGGLATTTALQAAAAVNADGSAGALVEAVALGDGTDILATAALAPLAAATFTTKDDELDWVVPTSVVFHWRVSGVDTTLSFASVTSAGIVTATNGGGTVGWLDTRTGKYSIEFHASEAPDENLGILVTYTPTAATSTVVDDGAGGWLSPATAGSIDYNTGAYTVTVPTAPHAYARVVVGYVNNAWNLDPISKGVWANGVKVQIYGNADSYTAATASYTSYNFLVRLYNSDSGLYDVVEQFEDVVLTDPDSLQYLPDVLNELSDYVQVTDPGRDAASAVDFAYPDLQGRAKSFVLAGGDESAGGQTIQATLPSVPVSPRSVSITYYDASAVAHTITDDGQGNLVGEVDGAGTNTIDYTTGAVDVKTSVVIGCPSFAVATYYVAPAETNHYELFGDTAKTYTEGTTVYYQAGSDGTFTSTTYGRSQLTSPTLEATSKGMYAFNKVEELLQIIVPDFAGDVVVTQDQLTYAASRQSLPQGGDRFIIISPPVGKTPQEAVDWVRYDLATFSNYAAVYYPWIKIADPLANNRPKLIPPLGHVAGVYARVDATRGVYKAPAGTVDGQLAFLLDVEYKTSQAERDLLYPNRINALAAGTNIGKAVWGCRTLSAVSTWRLVPVRRLFMYLEASIYNSTFWAAFEPNGPVLWNRMQTQIGSFLLRLFNAGYFAGNTPKDAFFVVCDSSNNDQSTIDNGEVITDVGVAPSKPAEFVTFRFYQKTL